MAKKKTGPVAGTYGIGEWYGKLYTQLSNTDRHALVAPGPMECRFRKDAPEAAPRKNKTLCSKKGGVCSLRRFPGAGQSAGPLTTTCPSRFLEGGKIFRFVGEELLGTSEPLLFKEIPFLMRPGDPSTQKPGKQDVGRIDMVLVKPGSEPLEWCALEMQAVYFSGASLKRDFEAIAAHDGSSLPLPQGNRRPDFRSSAPKRLMPQLQIKVPTLRRWGKKMAVVVDRPFFGALAEMDHVPHLSNCDIAWFVVRYDEKDQTQATLELDTVQFTTLERAVEGLPAGTPVSLDDFEASLKRRIRRKT